MIFISILELYVKYIIISIFLNFLDYFNKTYLYKYDIQYWNYYNDIDHITNNASESFNNYLKKIVLQKTFFILIDLSFKKRRIFILQ